MLLTFVIDTVQGYIAWWAVRSMIIWLDRKLPYEQNGIKRIIIQLVATTITGLFVIALLTELVSWIAKGKSAPLSFYTVDLIIISIWFFVINAIYMGLHYYNFWKASEEKLREESRLKAGGFMVKNGKQEIRVPFNDVAGFYVDDEYPIACLVSGKKYHMDKSLDKVEEELPSALFFRLNRQFMLHRQSLSGFKKIENGKLQVLTTMVQNFPSEITVSRTKAPAFKAWFRA